MLVSVARGAGTLSVAAHHGRRLSGSVPRAPGTRNCTRRASGWRRLRRASPPVRVAVSLAFPGRGDSSRRRVVRAARPLFRCLQPPAAPGQERQRRVAGQVVTGAAAHNRLRAVHSLAAFLTGRSSGPALTRRAAERQVR